MGRSVNGGRRAAFLRGINLGRRRLTMDRLGGLFEAMGLDDVATYLASGNVVFADDGREAADLEAAVERHLESELGYPVATFVRGMGRLRDIAELDLVPADDPGGMKVHVTFLKEPPDAGVEEALRALETPDDLFRVRGREVFWLRRGGLSDSTIRAGDLDRALGGGGGTMRTMNTVRRLVAKFG